MRQTQREIRWHPRAAGVSIPRDSTDADEERNNASNYGSPPWKCVTKTDWHYIEEGGVGRIDYWSSDISRIPLRKRSRGRGRQGGSGENAKKEGKGPEVVY